MRSTRFVILPGLDGGDAMLAEFARLAPDGVEARVLSLPDEPRDDYDSLAVAMASRIRPFAPCHLIAESFSGPLGILLASRYSELVDGLTLVASFATSPLPRIAKGLPWSLIMRVPMPLVIASRLFVGGDRELANALRAAIRRTSPATLARRLQCVMDVDVRSELAGLRCPLHYLRATQDRLVSLRAAKVIREVNAAATIIELEGPHLLLQTRPREAWEAITYGAAQVLPPAG